MACERSLRFQKVLESLQTQYHELLTEVHSLTYRKNEERESLRSEIDVHHNLRPESLQSGVGGQRPERFNRTEPDELLTEAQGLAYGKNQKRESWRSEIDDLKHNMRLESSRSGVSVQKPNRFSRVESDGRLQHMKKWDSMMSVNSSRGFGNLVGKKDKLKRQMRKSIRTSGHSDELYRKSGLSAKIAKSPWFRFIMLVVIVLNAIWVAADVDLHLGESHVVADTRFVAYHSLQSTFCAFFVFELSTRLVAFETKWEACKDLSYLIDVFLTAAMIVETVVLPCVRATMMPPQHKVDNGTSGMDDSSWVSRISDGLRCIQVCRISKFVLSLPETKSLMTCVVVGLRGVSAAGALVVACTYGFAVLLRVLSEGSHVGHEFFGSFPEALFTLLILGVLPESSHFIREIADEPWYVLCAICFFLVIVQLCIMNLLIGLLCKVVENVAESEREARESCFLKATMADVIAAVDSDSNGLVSKLEMFAVLESPIAIDALHHIGIDVVALVDNIDEFYEVAGVDEFGIDEFVEALQQYRATTHATVSVITELRRSMFRRLAALEQNIITAKTETLKTGNAASLQSTYSSL